MHVKVPDILQWKKHIRSQIMAKVAQLSVIKGVGSPVQEFVFFPQTSLGELTALPRSLAGKEDGIGGEGEGKGREWRGRKGKQWEVASS